MKGSTRMLVASVALSLASTEAAAQLSPTGSHYAGRATDTGASSVTNMGGYSTAVPIDVVPARGGLPVPVAVASGGRGAGAVGLGWDIPISSIRRDTSIARRRPAYQPGGEIVAREALTLTLDGQTLEMIPRDSTTWVARRDAPDLELKKVSWSRWRLTDGLGREFDFDTPMCAPSAPCAPLENLWLLTSITSADNRVELQYDVRFHSIDQLDTPTTKSFKGNGHSIDISLVRYNAHKSVTGCFKDVVRFAYAQEQRPLKIQNLDTQNIFRMTRLKELVVARTVSCNTESAVRRYGFNYATDPETKLQRLASVDMKGQDGTEEAKAVRVASYTYGSASNGSLSNPQMYWVQGPDVPLPADVGNVQVLASTYHDGGTSTPGGGETYVSWHTLIDITGDGRTDLVFKKNDQLWVAVNRPDGTFMTTLVADPTKQIGTQPLAKSSNKQRRYSYAWETRIQDWRQVIDVNADGRLDIVDAEQHAGEWTVYLNTPGTPITWVEKRINTFHIKTMLQNAGHEIEGGQVPLSRKTAGFDTKMSECYFWNGSKYELFAFPQACLYNPPYEPQQRVGPERTVLEWGLRDLNGDGYPDFMFSKSPFTRDKVDTSDWAYRGPSFTPIVARNMQMAISGTYVAYNVAGVRLNSENIFSLPAALEGQCPPESWGETGQGCGFGDVDGDGVQDRISGGYVHLGAGNPFVTATVEVVTDTSWSRTWNNHDDHCTIHPGTESSEQVRAALRDVNADGLADIVSDTGVYFGTGTGFAPVVPANGDPGWISSSVDDCDGEYSRTTEGLYDMDGDGKPELVKIAHNPGRLMVFYLVGGPGGRNAAGRITAIDDAYGAKTLVTYRSAKELDSSVPFPEIVVTSTQTVTTRGFGESMTSVNYAYGGARMFFDPLADMFTTRGYETIVEVYGTGAEQGQASYANVRMLNPLPPFSPGLSQAERFERYQTTGRPSYSFFVGYDVPRDPWVLLRSFDPWIDMRRLGSSRQFWKTRHLPVSTPTANSIDCEDIPDPLAWTEGGTGLSLCESRGFTYVSASESWAGTQPPPGSFSNIESRYEVLSIDDHANVLSFRNENDRHVADDDVCTLTTYATPVGGSRVVSAMATKLTTDCGPLDHRQVLHSETWEYDGLPPGSVETGRMTSHSVERFDTSTGASLGTIREYEATHDAAGNIDYIVTARGPAVRALEIFYDDYGLVPVGSRLDGSLLAPATVTTTRDPLTLVVRAQSDVNGTVWGQEVDGYGRTTKTSVTPAGGTLGVTSKTTYSGFDGLGQRMVRTKEFVDPVTPGPAESTTPGRETIGYLDELGRTKKVVKLLGADYANETVVAVSRTYDGLGRVSFDADPFPASESAATAYGTTYHYGTDGVLLCSIRGNGPQPLTYATDVTNERFPACQTRVFSNHTVQITTSAPDSLASGTPQAGVTRTSTLAATGRTLSRETSQNGVRLELETFTYNRLGQVTGLTRYRNPSSSTPEPVEWRFRYDSLGQQLSLKEPQAAERFNSFSDWGELMTTAWIDESSTPSKKMQIDRTYDAFGRITQSRQYDDSQDLSETKYEWFYDTDQGAPFTSTNTRGRLTRTHSAIGDMFVSYDGFGRANKRAFVDATDQAYLEQYDHRGDGSLARLELKLPDTGYTAEEWNYTYDSAGGLRSVVDGISGVPIYERHTVDPFGRVLSASYGPEVTVNASYANTGRRLPTQLTTLLDSGVSRDIHYGTFDAAGREQGRTETMGPMGPTTITSSYDALGRLETSTSSGGSLEFNTTFTYDALGNITSLDDTMAPKHVSLQFLSGANTDLDRLCRVDYGPSIVGPCTVRHDGSGNVLAMPTQTGTRTLTYFPSGAVKQITQGTTQASFRYDGSGEISELDVVGPKDPRQTRRYGLVERRRLNSGTDVLVRSIPGAGGLLATRRGPSGPYITPFSESRGLRFSTDGTKIAQDVSYLPFGQSVSSGDLNSLTHTSEQWNGGDNLSDLGVVRLGARIYDPVVGRFLSRDPLLVPRTAATTNPYAFAGNDPINFSDPTGLDHGLSICVTNGGSACASGSSDSSPAEVSAALAAGAFAVGVRLIGSSGGGSHGVSLSYLPRPASTADSITQLYAFAALPPEGEDFNAALNQRIKSTPAPIYSYSGPPGGFAQVYDFVGWVFGDPSGDFDNVPPFRILFRAAIEFGLSGGFSAVGLAGKAAAGARALGRGATVRGATRSVARAIEEEGSSIFYHGTTSSAAPGMLNNLQPVSTVTYGARLGSFFTVAAKEPDALIMASHFAIRYAPSNAISVVQVRIPNSLLRALSESSPRMMMQRAIPGFYGAPPETIFMPEALPYLNTAAEFSIVPPVF